jgi:cell division protein FtsI (penicillin-binding protein 3)
MGSFIGFASVDNPQVVITVIIDEPQGIKYGGVVAAPAFKAIGEQVLPYMGIYPKGVTYLVQEVSRDLSPPRPSGDDPKTESSAAPSKGSEILEEPGVMPDFSGKSIRQVIQISKKLGLNLRLEGSGRAVAQTPAPGQVLQGEIKGKVRFQPNI